MQNGNYIIRSRDTIPSLNSRKGVTVKGSQRGIGLCLSASGFVEGAFVFGIGILCLWKNTLGTSLFQKSNLLFLLSLVTNCSPHA